MRRGFSLITAIVFMILVATLGALALSLSNLSVKQTSDLYLREQAELLVQSGTEYALLAISGHDIVANGNCINTINATYSVFDINMTIYYLGSGLPNNGCRDFSNNIIGIHPIINTNESNVTIMIDTVVSVPVDKNITTEPIRLHRRTIQKP